jgi:hypothetical protein
VRLEDPGDALEHGVAREVPVSVVDVSEQVEVGHDHRERRAGPFRALELLAQCSGEVARVEEPRLRIDPGLLLQCRDAQRAVDEEQRGQGGRKQQRVPLPQAREGDAERGEHEVRGQALRREETGRAQRVSAREVEHRREEDMVQGDEHDHRDESRERQLDLGPQPGVSHELHRRPRRQTVHRVVGDVETLDVPGVAHLQPLGQPVDDPEERDQLRRQQEHRGDQEDVARVVALVARRDDDEELRDRGARGEDEEGRPAGGVGRQVRERDERREDGEDPDGVEVDLRAPRDRGGLRAVLPGRRAFAGELARVRAHFLAGAGCFAGGLAAQRNAGSGRRAIA